MLETNAGYLLLGDGSVLASDLFVPTSAVGRNDGKRIDLTVSTAEASVSGWDRGQAGGITR